MPKLSQTELDDLNARRAGNIVYSHISHDPAFDGVDIPTPDPTPIVRGLDGPAGLPGGPSTSGPAAPPGAQSHFGKPASYSWPSNPRAFAFATPLNLLATYAPHLKPHQWQQEELYRIGGDLNLEGIPRDQWLDPTQINPYIYNLVAANGSGKDTYVIAPTAIWFAMRYIRAKIVITSESHPQLKDQTFKPIVSWAESINAAHGEEVFIIRELSIKCSYTGSEIQGFCSDEPSKVEGRHPFSEHPDAKMLIIINEAKSIKDVLYGAFSRFTGYSHWMQVSSAGGRAGQFYKSVDRSTTDKLILGKPFARKVTAFECPNISPTHIEQVLLNHGERSYEYQTGILSEFFESAEDVVIPSARIEYIPPARHSYNLQTRAGLDVGLGGDPSEFWVVRGNHCLYHAETSTSSPNRLHEWIIDQLKLSRSRFGLLPEDCTGDAGGIGAPILKRIVEAGYPIGMCNNQSPAMDSDSYANRGAEMYFRVGRLFELQVLVPPKDFSVYAKWLKQLTTRKYFQNDKQKLQLEAKPKAKGRLGFSPDCADAYVLAYSGYPLDLLLTAPSVDTKTPEQQMERLVQEFERKAFEPTEPFDIFRRPSDNIARIGLMYNVIYK